ncbi:MAG TPA: hypothetical protein VLC46_06895 [Thermoanaerobaculia bacterium]|jgi:hypothetical protein|nr:hypothetical protein [Thermoanaerobaculia bacterium]
MSTQNVVPATPSPVSYRDAAQALMQQTRAMREQIPNLVIPLNKKEGRRLASGAAVPAEFVQLTAAAVSNSAPLGSAGGTDPAKARDLLSYADEFGPLADELEALAFFVRHSVTAARNEVGSDALTTYAMAKALAKRPATADLAPHVDDMSRALGRRRKTKSSKSQPAPVPATPVPAEPPPVTSSSPATPSK